MHAWLPRGRESVDHEAGGFPSLCPQIQDYSQNQYLLVNSCSYCWKKVEVDDNYFFSSLSSSSARTTMKEELHIFVFMILLACSFAVALGSPPSKCSPVGKWQISISEQMRSELTFLATNTLRMRQVRFSPSNLEINWSTSSTWKIHSINVFQIGDLFLCAHIYGKMGYDK